MPSPTRTVRTPHEILISYAVFFEAGVLSYLTVSLPPSTAATAALRRKKMHEGDLDKLSGVRLQLEVQINTLESANINANTLDVMRRGANALKDIHNGLCVPPPSISGNFRNTDRRRNLFLFSLILSSFKKLVWFFGGFTVTLIRSMRR